MRKKVLTLIMALAMLLSLVPTALAAEFKDMADVDGWAEEGVGRWGGEGVFNGDQNGNFNPEAGLTRAEAAQVLVNLMHLDGTADLSKFADYETVLKDHWAVPALEAVVAAGILNGDETGLNPEGSVDRQMMFVMIARALGIKPITETEKDIPDIDKADNWASGYIMALVDIGAIHGVDAEGSVDPLTDINRQTTAVLFDQLIGGYGNEDGDKIKIEEGKITLVVADNVTVTGEADPDLPIVVAGEAVKVDASEVTGEAKIAVNVDDAEVAAPEGAVVTPAEGVTGVTVNNEAVEAGEDYTVPEQEETTPTNPGGQVPPAPTTYTVTLATATDGTLTSASTLTGLSSGAKVTVVATPAAGKDLTKLEVGTTDVTSSAVKDDEGKYTYELTVTGNVTVTATFGAVTRVDVYFYAIEGTFPNGACYGGENAQVGGNTGTANPGTCDSGYNDATGSDSGTATPSTKNVAKFTINVGTIVDLGTVTKPEYTGYTFGGWSTSNANRVVNVSGNYTVTATSNVVKFYAVWYSASKTYTVIFMADPNGEFPTTACYGGNNGAAGGNGQAINPGTCDGGYNDTVGQFTGTQKPSSATKGYYITVYGGTEINIDNLTKPDAKSGKNLIFDGWYTAEEGGVKVSDKYTVTGDVTLYAHWRDAQHTVTFYANGGSFPKNACYAGDNTQPGSSDITQDPGSCFGGFNDENGSGTTTQDPSYEGYKIGVKDGTTINLDKMQGVVYAGHTFKGWSTTENGEVITNKTVTVESDLTYYAIWEVNSEG